MSKLLVMGSRSQRMMPNDSGVATIPKPIFPTADKSLMRAKTLNVEQEIALLENEIQIQSQKLATARRNNVKQIQRSITTRQEKLERLKAASYPQINSTGTNNNKDQGGLNNSTPSSGKLAVVRNSSPLTEIDDKEMNSNKPIETESAQSLSLQGELRTSESHTIPEASRNQVEVDSFSPDSNTVVLQSYTTSHSNNRPVKTALEPVRSLLGTSSPSLVDLGARVGEILDNAMGRHETTSTSLVMSPTHSNVYLGRDLSEGARALMIDIPAPDSSHDVQPTMPDSKSVGSSCSSAPNGIEVDPPVQKYSQSTPESVSSSSSPAPDGAEADLEIQPGYLRADGDMPLGQGDVVLPRVLNSYPTQNTALNTSEVFNLKSSVHSVAHDQEVGAIPNASTNEVFGKTISISIPIAPIPPSGIDPDSMVLPPNFGPDAGPVAEGSSAGTIFDLTIQQESLLPGKPQSLSDPPSPPVPELSPSNATLGCVSESGLHSQNLPLSPVEHSTSTSRQIHPESNNELQASQSMLSSSLFSSSIPSAKLRELFQTASEMGLSLFDFNGNHVLLEQGH
ncbi:hypothetical protein GYMLUDRAFT_62043 [Collybiopsis luxurians FD-317 M1]|uniref:Uncharacterized protein n=1 Tax=Collybiopsis luxurians FD-317 M1 TaxID=944289 RepID=A0A0D0C271_9AGAR|nr:hypothetical protein GYMLUDRAFT_62043 [Collybiopsis luxurians FD-317 M1]